MTVRTLLTRKLSADVEFVAGAPSSLYLLVSTATGTELRRSDDDGATSHPVHAFPTSEVVIDGRPIP